MKIVLYMLAESVAHRLRKNGFKCRVVEISIRDNELYSFTRQRKINMATNITEEIAREGYKLFKENYSWQVNVRGLGVSISDFTNADQISFDTSVEKQIKKENLEQTIENLRYRFGRSAINRAVVLREKKFAELDIKDGHSGNSLGKKH